MYARDGTGTRGYHLTVAAARDKAGAQQHLQTLQTLQTPYVLKAGRPLNTCCVIADVPQKLWGPMDASRAKWPSAAESHDGRYHVMHIAGANQGQIFDVRPWEATMHQIARR